MSAPERTRCAACLAEPGVVFFPLAWSRSGTQMASVPLCIDCHRQAEHELGTLVPWNEARRPRRERTMKRKAQFLASEILLWCSNWRAPRGLR